MFDNFIVLIKTFLCLKVKLMAPVARRLENISEKIMTTGETILHQLQFVPKRLSLDDIPGGMFFKIIERNLDH